MKNHQIDFKALVDKYMPTTKNELMKDIVSGNYYNTEEYLDEFPGYVVGKIKKNDELKQALNASPDFTWSIFARTYLISYLDMFIDIGLISHATIADGGTVFIFSSDNKHFAVAKGVFGNGVQPILEKKGLIK